MTDKELFLYTRAIPDLACELVLCRGLCSSTAQAALVRPLLKKAGLDPNLLSNYRPVSKLPFISKVLETVAATSLRQPPDYHRLHEPYQSAYRSNHGVETALMRVQNGILQAVERIDVTILVLFDLWAGFGTFDNTVLLRRFTHQTGVTDAALAWVVSYLKDRTQTVHIGDDSSGGRAELLHYAVSQGSVLDPQLFSNYIFPVCHVMSSYGLDKHFRADETQWYCAFKPVQQRLSSQLVRIIQSALIPVASGCAWIFLSSMIERQRLL